MQACLLITIVMALQGCAYYLTQRPPIMERKMGYPLAESVGVLATAADYRVVYVRIKPGAPICPEPSPDVAGQFASSVAAVVAASPANREASLEAEANLALSMKQLVHRTQGVQHYRDAATDLCIDRLNGFISEADYLADKRALRKNAYNLILKELPLMHNLKYDAVRVPEFKINKREDKQSPAQ